MVVERAVLALGRGPALPAIGCFEDVGVFLPVERRLGGFVLLQPVEVFQEKQPRGLLGGVQLAGATGVLSEHVVDVFAGLLEPGDWEAGRESASLAASVHAGRDLWC